MPNSNHPPEKLITPQEAAEMLGVRVGTLSVWRCTKRVALPFVRVGRAVRYSPREILAFIETQTIRTFAGDQGISRGEKRSLLSSREGKR